MLHIDLSGKRALVMGVTNKRSLGWAIADKLQQAGAQMAFSYQGERLKGEVEKLTAHMDDVRLYQVDVTEPEQMASLFGDLKEAWGEIDIECTMMSI